MTSAGQVMKTPKKRNEETQMANNYIIPAAERFMTATEAIEFGLCDKVVNSIL